MILFITGYISAESETFHKDGTEQCKAVGQWNIYVDLQQALESYLLISLLAFSGHMHHLFFNSNLQEKKYPIDLLKQIKTFIDNCPYLSQRKLTTLATTAELLIAVQSVCSVWNHKYC